MKRFFLLIVIPAFCLINICSAQVYKYIYHFDESLVSTNASSAVVTGKGFTEDSLFRLDYFGRDAGNLFMSAHFIDSSLQVMEGQMTIFYKNGKVESQGNYLKDRKNGLWQQWDSLGLKKDSSVYLDNNAIKKATFAYNKNKRLSYYAFTDSLADTLKTISYDENGLIDGEVFFKGQLGVSKKYESGSIKLDSFYTREEKEASFSGGQAAWVSYLQRNLKANTPVKNRAPEGAYQVIVKFIVGIDGNLSGIQAETNHGYGMETEVIRILKKGPAWQPAKQYGRNVNAYRRQPVTFIVESN